MAKTTRISMSIDKNLLDELNYVSNVLQVSRSSLITEILIESVNPLKEVIELSISCSEKNDKEVNPLARNPEKVRSYLDSLKTAVEQRRDLFNAEFKKFATAMDGQRNGH